MKRLFLFAGLLLLTMLFAAGQENKRLTILHTNDFHSHLQGFAPESAYTPLVKDNDPTRGGIARIAGIIGAVRNENPGTALVVDAGDCLMGTLFQALEPSTGFEIELMKKAGYDVVAVGNHDFDFGPEVYAGILRKAARDGEIPVMLLGNAVTDPDDPADDAFEAVMSDGLIRPWVIREINGLKVGLFSLLGKDADESAPYAVPVTFEKNKKAAKRLVKVLQKQDCDVIICLSHSGVTKDKNGNWAGEDADLARKVKGIDIIISGHTHTYLSEPVVVNGVPIVSAGSSGMNVGRLDINVGPGGVSLEKYTMIAVDDSIEGLEAIQEAVESQKKEVDRAVLAPLSLTYDMPVALATFPMEADEHGDLPASNLGALIADAIHYYVNEYGPGTDIAMVALGVIRDPIQPGVQSVADIFRVMSLGSGNDSVPGYALSRLWVTGRELKNIAEILIMSSASTPSHFCYYSHLRIEYDPKGGILNKIRKLEFTDRDGNVTEVNTSKNDSRLYSIVANSYMLDFVGIIKKMSFGLINVVPKDGDGRPVANMDSAVMDFDQATAGVQEGKEWLALVRYLQQFPPVAEGGLPVIPDSYRNPGHSLVTTGKK
jgi:5'-nucleotidase